MNVKSLALVFSKVLQSLKDFGFYVCEYGHIWWCLRDSNPSTVALQKRCSTVGAKAPKIRLD